MTSEGGGVGQWGVCSASCACKGERGQVRANDES